jgi:hypothetical protein
MLDTLRNLDDRDALMLLSSTVHSLLPDPGVGSRITDVLNAPAKSRAQLLHELRHKLHLNADDRSPIAQAKIFDTLSSEISKYALKNADIRQIKARLGARGDLNPSSYEVDVPSDRRDDLAVRGIRPNHIEDALHTPDAVQHLSSERNDFLVSLFLKRVGSGRDAFTLLVVARRDGYLLRVRDALRIYHSDVDIKGAHEPFAVLRAFLNRYGVPIQIGPRAGLLLLDEVFPFAGTKKELDNMATLDGKPWRSRFVEWDGNSTYVSNTDIPGFRGVALVRVEPHLSVAEIVIAYAFDDRKYDEDLRRHGVPVPRD